MRVTKGKMPATTTTLAVLDDKDCLLVAQPVCGKYMQLERAIATGEFYKRTGVNLGFGTLDGNRYEAGVDPGPERLLEDHATPSHYIQLLLAYWLRAMARKEAVPEIHDDVHALVSDDDFFRRVCDGEITPNWLQLIIFACVSYAHMSGVLVTNVPFEEFVTTNSLAQSAVERTTSLILRAATVAEGPPMNDGRLMRWASRYTWCAVCPCDGSGSMRKVDVMKVASKAGASWPHDRELMQGHKPGHVPIQLKATSSEALDTLLAEDTIPVLRTGSSSSSSSGRGVYYDALLNNARSGGEHLKFPDTPILMQCAWRTFRGLISGSRARRAAMNAMTRYYPLQSEDVVNKKREYKARKTEFPTDDGGITTLTSALRDTAEAEGAEVPETVEEEEEEGGEAADTDVEGGTGRPASITSAAPGAASAAGGVASVTKRIMACRVPPLLREYVGDRKWRLESADLAPAPEDAASMTEVQRDLMGMVRIARPSGQVWVHVLGKDVRTPLRLSKSKDSATLAQTSSRETEEEKGDVLESLEEPDTVSLNQSHLASIAVNGGFPLARLAFRRLLMLAEREDEEQWSSVQSVAPTRFLVIPEGAKFEIKAPHVEKEMPRILETLRRCFHQTRVMRVRFESGSEALFHVKSVEDAQRPEDKERGYRRVFIHSLLTTTGERDNEYEDMAVGSDVVPTVKPEDLLESSVENDVEWVRGISPLAARIVLTLFGNAS